MSISLQNKVNSDLLFTRADETQGFVHDTYRDYYLASWFVHQINSGRMTVQQLHEKYLSYPVDAKLWGFSEQQETWQAIKPAVYSLIPFIDEQLEHKQSKELTDLIRVPFFKADDVIRKRLAQLKARSKHSTFNPFAGNIFHHRRRYFDDPFEFHYPPRNLNVFQFLVDDSSLLRTSKNDSLEDFLFAISLPSECKESVRDLLKSYDSDTLVSLLNDKLDEYASYAPHIKKEAYSTDISSLFSSGSYYEFRKMLSTALERMNFDRTVLLFGSSKRFTPKKRKPSSLEKMNETVELAIKCQKEIISLVGALAYEDTTKILPYLERNAQYHQERILGNFNRMRSLERSTYILPIGMLYGILLNSQNVRCFDLLLMTYTPVPETGIVREEHFHSRHVKSPSIAVDNIPTYFSPEQNRVFLPPRGNTFNLYHYLLKHVTKEWQYRKVVEFAVSDINRYVNFSPLLEQLNERFIPNGFTG